MKLNEDQKDLLRNLDPAEWEAIAVYCEIICKQMADRILTQDIEGDGASRKLTLAKARHEGAKALLSSIVNAKDNLKEKQDVRRRMAEAR